MKKIIIFGFIAAALNAHAQEIPKGTNQIIVKNISFPTIVNSLLDQKYEIDKVDSAYKTVKTMFHECRMANGKQSLIQMLIMVRVKDSTAIITGKFFNLIMAPEGNPKPQDILEVEYGWGAARKLAFQYMENFARSLSSDISYAKL